MRVVCLGLAMSLTAFVVVEVITHGAAFAAGVKVGKTIYEPVKSTEPTDEEKAKV
jgi:hypothetical protein